jgi:hypothetical protein
LPPLALFTGFFNAAQELKSRMARIYLASSGILLAANLRRDIGAALSKSGQTATPWQKAIDKQYDGVIDGCF